MICFTLTGCSKESKVEVDSIEVPYEIEERESIKDYENSSYSKYQPSTEIVKDYVSNKSLKVIGIEDIEICELMYPYIDTQTGILKVAGVDGFTNGEYCLHTIECETIEEVFNKIKLSYMLTNMSWLISMLSNDIQYNPIDFSDWEWTVKHEMLYEDFCNQLLLLYSIDKVDELSFMLKKQDYTDVCCDAYCIRKNMNVYDDTYESSIEAYLWVAELDGMYYLFLPKFDVESYSYHTCAMTNEMCDDYLNSDNLAYLLQNVICVSVQTSDEEKLTEDAYLFRDTLNKKIFYVER